MELAIGQTEMENPRTCVCVYLLLPIGYLATAGGKVLALNGNNSYGEYGCEPEGYDIDVPITGTVNNRSKEAQIYFKLIQTEMKYTELHIHTQAKVTQMLQ